MNDTRQTFPGQIIHGIENAEPQAVIRRRMMLRLFPFLRASGADALRGILVKHALLDRSKLDQAWMCREIGIAAHARHRVHPAIGSAQDSTRFCTAFTRGLLSQDGDCGCAKSDCCGQQNAPTGQPPTWHWNSGIRWMCCHIQPDGFINATAPSAMILQHRPANARALFR